MQNTQKQMKKQGNHAFRKYFKNRILKYNFGKIKKDIFYQA